MSVTQLLTQPSSTWKSNYLLKNNVIARNTAILQEEVVAKEGLEPPTRGL
jgi:hypothetical protein